MDAKRINKFPIREYLAKMNFYPTKDRGYYGMYHSPFREDNSASMKVDYNKNLWIDYGINEGGTLIDLVMRIKNCSNGEAMRLLEQNLQGIASSSFHGNKEILLKEIIEPKSNIKITDVLNLKNSRLLHFLRTRRIYIEMAEQYCKEVHYSVNNKHYYAIGFQNDSEGWNLRNEYFKGCTSSDITTFDDKLNHCCIFEGFMDYLSFLTSKGKTNIESNVIVLNSVTNLYKAMGFLEQQKAIYTYLDNDDAGRKCLNEIQKLGIAIDDQSKVYNGYKDLNDYLCGKKQIQKKPGLKL